VFSSKPGSEKILFENYFKNHIRNNKKYQCLTGDEHTFKEICLNIWNKSLLEERLEACLYIDSHCLKSYFLTTYALSKPENTHDRDMCCFILNELSNGARSRMC